jgi:hypothetical protein
MFFLLQLAAAIYMPVWLFALLVGFTDVFSTAMFLQIESLAGLGTFSNSGAFLALVYGAVGSYALAWLRFYGSHQAHLLHFHIDALYPFLVTFQVIVLKFFRIQDGFHIIWSPSPSLQNIPHLVGMGLFIAGIFLMSYFQAPAR